MKFKNPISELFAESPMRPMQKHMAKVCECVAVLTDFIAALTAHDLALAHKAQAKIVDLENEADELKKDIRDHLPKNLFLPVPRADLLSLLKTQDKLANKARDIAGVMLGREMTIPDPIQSEMKTFADLCISTTKQAQKVVNELDVLVISSFAGRQALNTIDIINILDDIEHETDILQISIRRKLFAIERELNPIDVMFLYRIIEWFGDLADNAQRVGHQMGILLAK